MSRKVETVLTLSVRFKLPESSNTSQVIEFVRTAICSYGKDVSFIPDDLIVKLIEKKTTYV